MIEIAPGAEAEDDLALLTVGQVERHQDRAAGIHRRADLAGKPHARQRRRVGQPTVAPEELGAIAGQRARHVVDVEERDAPVELRVVGVAREQRAAGGVDLGDHVHCRFRPEIAEHPFDIAGGGQLARTARTVAHFQHREFDRFFEIDINPQFRADAAGGVFEDAVTEAVTADVGHRAAARQRCRRPDMAAFLVAQIQGFAAGGADRIVAPWCQAEFVGVLAPGVAQAALGDDGSEIRIRDHVDPGRRCSLRLRGGDHILAAVGAEAAVVVAEDEVRSRRVARCRRLGAMASGRHEPPHALVGQSAPVDLFDQRAAAVGDDDARNRLQQDAVLVGNLLGRAYENAAGAVDGGGFGAGRDQAHDLVLQPLPVAHVIFVPDHQIDHQTFQAPVGVALDELPREVDVLAVGDLQQHDRQIAGNRVAPETGLPAPVLEQHAGLGAQRGIGVKHGAGQPSVELSVGFGGVDLPQRHAAVRPGEIEHPVGETPVLVFLDQRHAGFAVFGSARNPVDGRRLLGLERDPAADRDDRIEHRTFGSGQRVRLAHRARRGDGAAAADEAHAIGLVRHLADVRPVARQQMEQPWRLLADRARPARAEDRVALADDFGLHEKVAERSLHGVRCGGSEHDFRVAGDFDDPARARAVGDAHAAQFDIVFRRDDNLRIGFDIVVAAPEFGAAFGEHRLVAVGALAGRLVRGRPELAADHVAQIEKRAPVIAGAVFAPARDREVAPAAVAAAGVGHHDMVAAVRQQLHFRRRRVRTDRRQHRGFRTILQRAGFRVFVKLRLERRVLRNPLLQQQQRRLERRVRFETPLHGPVEQQIFQRQQAHALVMGHERTHDHTRLAARHARRRVVDRLVETIPAFEPVARQSLEIRAGRLGRHHQGECGGIRGDDRILRQAALESEAGHTEGVILIVETGVDGVVAGFRDAPGQAPLIAVGDLPGHGGAASLVEQRAVVRRHHQHRHQIFEHRAAPGHQDRLAAGGRQQAAQRKPAFLRQLSLGNGDEGAQPRFRGQQIVKTGVAPELVDVVADREQVAGAVVEEFVIHRCQSARFQRQVFAGGDSFLRTFAAGADQPAQIDQPVPLVQGRGFAESCVEHRLQFAGAGCQFAQRRNPVDIFQQGEMRKSRRRIRALARDLRSGPQQQAGRQRFQFFERLTALPLERPRPFRRLGFRRRSEIGGQAGRAAGHGLETAQGLGQRRRTLRTGVVQISLHAGDRRPLEAGRGGRCGKRFAEAGERIGEPLEQALADDFPFRQRQ